MDLPKIKTLIDFVGRSNVTELTVREKDVTVRIVRAAEATSSAFVNGTNGVYDGQPGTQAAASHPSSSPVKVRAPIFGVLHRTSAPGQPPFVQTGDIVEKGQTLFIIEAMKVFNQISAPVAGRIAFLTEIDGGEVETDDLLAEIA